ncbi:hypothetical protein OAF61_04700 [Pseudomonadales bacterium]|nr:hypothetical protein [Pseudomonadales bacterium]
MSSVEMIFEHTSSSGVSGELCIDGEGKLYWNGTPVVTQQKVKLQWWVNLSAIMAAVSTVVIAAVTVLSFSADMQFQNKYSVLAHDFEIELARHKNEVQALEAKNKEYSAQLENYLNQAKSLNKARNPTATPPVR